MKFNRLIYEVFKMLTDKFRNLLLTTINNFQFKNIKFQVLI